MIGAGTRLPSAASASFSRPPRRAIATPSVTGVVTGVVAGEVTGVVTGEVAKLLGVEIQTSLATKEPTQQTSALLLFLNSEEKRVSESSHPWFGASAP